MREAITKEALAIARAYAQVLLSRSPWIGAAVALATGTVARVGAIGLVAVVASSVAARLLSLEEEATNEGVYGYNALLIGLGVATTFQASLPLLAAIAIVGAAASVLVMSALRSRFAVASLPVLTLPFLGVYMLMIAAAPSLGIAFALPPPEDLTPAFLPEGLATFFRALGTLFFLPRWSTGALLVSALVAHSRIGAVLALAGFVAASSLTDALGIGGTLLARGIAENGMLVAVALGGVWFVPSLASLALGLAGVACSTLLAAGLAGPLGRLGLPALIVPFNLTVLVVLLALRQRSRDQHPKSVDFPSSTPEQSLEFFRARLARFRAPYAVRFHLPVRGRWTCTQGVDGPHTHQGPWRHAFDFEVLGDDRRPHAATSTTVQLSDFHCYRLPVLAAAAGTVVKLEGDVADNAVGEFDAQKNWGNFILVLHAPGLYSLVAHLARGSIKVREGQVVRRGEVLGLCGSSGRSPVPHLHFQLQGTHLLGAPTLPCAFSDVVMAAGGDGAGERVIAAHVPAAGETLRNLDPQESVAACFQFRYGDTQRYRSGDGDTEGVLCDVDLYGQLLLRSRERGAHLVYERGDDVFTAWDVSGSSRSALGLLRAALPRVPLEESTTLTWSDVVPARVAASTAWARLAGRVVPQRDVEMDYRMAREGERLVVHGRSRRTDRRGEPLLVTRGELVRGIGVVRLWLSARGRALSVERALGAEQAEKLGAHLEAERAAKAG